MSATPELIIYSADICVDCYMTGHGVFEGEGDTNELGYRFMSYLWHVDSYTDISGDNSEPHFSWSMCQGCHSHLGGDRFTVDVIHQVRV